MCAGFNGTGSVVWTIASSPGDGSGGQTLPNEMLIIYDPKCTFSTSSGAKVRCTFDSDEREDSVYLKGK